MPGIKVIITGATGMVGEGVLFECLQNTAVAEACSLLTAGIMKCSTPN